MSGPRTPLQAAAAAGCGQDTECCDEIESKKNQSDRDRSGDTVFKLVCKVLHRHYHVHVPGVCVLCPCITKNAHILMAYKYNVRPQGCQAREHRCRQLLQLVAVEIQIPAAKQKAKKFIRTRKQDSIRLRKVSDVHQNSLCFEIQLFFMTKHAHIPFHTITQVRPQGCQAREHGCRQLLKLVAAKVQEPATK
jgi:hypothetical protein